MKTKLAVKAAPPSQMRIVKQKEAGIFQEMNALSKKHGMEVFRIAGQRFFKRQREEDALKREIAERERELAALQRKAAR